LLMIAAATRTATTPTTCAGIRRSSWRSTACRMVPAYARSPPSRAWRTCPMPAPCCAWAALWSISTAPGSGRSRSGSCWILMEL
jgi:hypothetical protein